MKQMLIYYISDLKIKVSFQFYLYSTNVLTATVVSKCFKLYNPLSQRHDFKDTYTVDPEIMKTRHIKGPDWLWRG